MQARIQKRGYVHNLYLPLSLTGPTLRNSEVMTWIINNAPRQSASSFSFRRKEAAQPRNAMDNGEHLLVRWTSGRTVDGLLELVELS